MARDGSGTYTLPAGSTITNGDTSDATDLNTPLGDIETDLNTARPVVAGGTGATTEKAARTNLFFAKGADVASASALSLGADGNYFDVTGTTTITSIGTWNVGDTVMLQFDGALTLTHHATDLILPGGADITTAAGDHAIFTEYASGDWRCVSYQRAASPPANTLSGSDEDNSLSSTSTDITGIPSGVTEVDVIIDSATFGTAATLLIQLGDGGGIETTGYEASMGQISPSGGGTPSVTSSTSGFLWSSASEHNGILTLKLASASNNTWIATGTSKLDSGSAFTKFHSGIKALSAEIDRIRVTTTGGTEAFTGGTVTVRWRK